MCTFKFPNNSKEVRTLCDFSLILYEQELANKKKFWHYQNHVILYSLKLNALHFLCQNCIHIFRLVTIPSSF